MSSLNDNNNFELLYKNLKQDYEQAQKDNDEICKEYESTIQLLTESAESFKKDKKELQNLLLKLENEQKQIKREKESLIKKNKDKMIDIQCLNEQNDKLNILNKKLKEEKSLFETKIVTLENDIEHSKNKIREYEDFIDELKTQLEDALEENITLQTEFETYKLNTGEELIRKEEELREIRNDITYKDKILQKLNKKSTDKINFQKLQEKFNNDKMGMRYNRRYTTKSKKEFKSINIQNKLNKIKEQEYGNNENIDNDTLSKELNVILEDNELNNRKLMNCKTVVIKVDDNENNSFFNSNNETPINNISKYSNFKDAENNNKNNKEIDVKEGDNKMKLQQKDYSFHNLDNMNGLNNIIKKQFGDLAICEENKIYLNPLINQYLSKDQKKYLVISLQGILKRIQQRKNNIYNKKKEIHERLQKLRNN